MGEYHLLQGDCVEVLRTLPAESVQCVVTSPPYLGLRDYGTATWEGGSVECDHRQQLGGEGATSIAQNRNAGTQTRQYRDLCGKCGARRIDNQIGLEATPDCGRPIMKLRGNLTEKEYDYVVSRLKELGMI